MLPFLVISDRTILITRSGQMGERTLSTAVPWALCLKDQRRPQLLSCDALATGSSARSCVQEQDLDRVFSVTRNQIFTEVLYRFNTNCL